MDMIQKLEKQHSNSDLCGLDLRNIKKIQGAK